MEEFPFWAFLNFFFSVLKFHGMSLSPTWLDLFQDLLLSYHEWHCFPNVFLCMFLICIQGSYYFLLFLLFTWVLYPDNFLNVFINYRGILAEFVGTSVYRYSSLAEDTPHWPILSDPNPLPQFSSPTLYVQCDPFCWWRFPELLNVLLSFSCTALFQFGFSLKFWLAHIL